MYVELYKYVLQYFEKRVRRLSSSHLRSSLLSPGPVQCVSIKGSFSIPTTITITRTSCPMSPYRGEHFQFTDSGSHILDLDLRVLGR